MLWRQLNGNQLRCAKQLSSALLSQSRATSSKTAAAVTLAEAKPYAELPGPSRLQMIRAFLPGGRYRGRSTSDMFLDLYQRYGSIFRLPSVASVDIVFCMNPQDYELIFRNEGQYPYRRSFETMDYFKKVHRKEIFGDYDGLTSGNGPGWAKLRSAVNPILLQPRNAKLYMANLLKVNDEFLERIRLIRDPHTLEMPADFADEIRHLVLESICSVALNTHLGLLGANRDSLEVKQLIEALQQIVELSFQLDMLPAVWKYVAVPQFKQLMRCMDTITDFCIKYIEQALQRIEASEGPQVAGLERSLLEKLASSDRQTAVITAMDFLFAGVDPTLISLSGTLLSLAKNPAKQQLLLQELQTVLPTKHSALTMDNMRNLPYLRACIKEGIRLYPFGPGTLRRMPHDVVLSGYRVLAGTDVGTAANYQMANMEQYVPRVREFLPERWLRGNSNRELIGDTATPFMYLPFGFGPRACAGKRIVDMMMEIAIARLVRNFEIGFDYPIEEAFKQQFFVKPNIPFKFKFVERQQ